MTKKEMFAAIKALDAVQANADMVAFIDHEIELLSKKRTGTAKPSKVQIENEGIKTEILEILAGAELPMTIGEINKALEGEYTSQKISALCRQLRLAKQIEKTVEKKVARFALAAVAE